MKAIAMKATQENWDSVKDLVKDYRTNNGIIHDLYLLVNTNGVVIFCSKKYLDNTKIEVYETFDRAIFLDALDIVEEKIWNGSELQIRHDNGWVDCHELNYYRLKPINPEVKKLQELADKLGYKIEKL